MAKKLIQECEAALQNLLWAASERDKKNRIRQFDQYIDDAREVLKQIRDEVDAEPLEFTVDNYDLQVLLNMTVLLCEGRGNMDVGMYWQDKLEKVEQQLTTNSQPVGYWQGEYIDGGAFLYEVKQESAFGYKYPNLPLYGSPPKQKDLTDDEYFELWSLHHNSEGKRLTHSDEYERAIIAAYKEKNK